MPGIRGVPDMPSVVFMVGMPGVWYAQYDLNAIHEAHTTLEQMSTFEFVFRT